ncbi:MAG TPA: segregation/condensation protein A [Candidatus Binataceae bacterium]|nr:segregation/condensation protein A [Candidatus Binataceae bacterium]
MSDTSGAEGAASKRVREVRPKMMSVGAEPENLEGALSSADLNSGMMRFRLPVYEGPLDLLLHLIKRAELDPHDVTASIITEQYLEHLNLMEELNLDVAGEYLVMAATLLLIKSFTLLPHPAPDDTEEAEELKHDLVARLLEYQRYREAAVKLGERPVLGRDVFASPGERIPQEDRPAEQLSVSIFDLVQAIAVVLKRLSDRTPRKIELRDIPVAQCIPRVLAALGEGMRVEFTALFDDLTDRPLIIATFMALLELIRRGAVRAWQEERPGPILLGRGDRWDVPHPEAAAALQNLSDEADRGIEPTQSGQAGGGSEEV